MGAYVELWAPQGRRIQRLTADRMTIGSSSAAEIRLEDDTVSSLHAVLETYGEHVSIRDLGSRNGTYINGERIWSEQALRPDDEIRVGTVVITYRADEPMTSLTQASLPPPDLTRRERDVLLELCRPFGTGDIFTEPASIKTIAKALVVTEAAVKQHLLNLYEKFEIPEGVDRRRVRLANDAIRRGAVHVGELRRPKRK